MVNRKVTMNVLITYILLQYLPIQAADHMPSLPPKVQEEIKKAYEERSQNKMTPTLSIPFLMEIDLNKVPTDLEHQNDRQYINLSVKLTTEGLQALLKKIQVTTRKGTLLSSKPISVKEVSKGGAGGWYTDQVFLVTYANGNDKENIIVKIMKPDESKQKTNKPNRFWGNHSLPINEAQRLACLRTEEMLEKWAHAHNPDFPNITLDLGTYSYLIRLPASTHPQRYFLTILEAASGQSADHWMNQDHTLPQGEEKNKFLATIERIGKALGAFHYELASKESQQALQEGSMNIADLKTVVHSDFHLGNIFVSDDKISFIDNGDMCNSTKKPESIQKDFEQLLSNTWWNFRKASRSDKVTVFQKFIEGYAQGYPKAVRQYILDTFKVEDETPQFPWKNMWWVDPKTPMTQEQKLEMILEPNDNW